MANEQNLIPANKRTPRERKEIASKGAKACNEAKRRKKELRECLEILLEKEIKAKNGEVMSGAEAISIQMFNKALKGDIRAFEVVRDTAGQKPIERVQVAEVTQSDIDAIEEAFSDGQTDSD